MKINSKGNIESEIGDIFFYDSGTMVKVVAKDKSSLERCASGIYCCDCPLSCCRYGRDDYTDVICEEYEKEAMYDYDLETGDDIDERYVPNN